MTAVNLGIPIYLNQQVVFDLLAALDDGFSSLSSIKAVAGETESSKRGISASIGVSNVFALLGVSFSGDAGKEKGVQRQTEVTEERVHTPTSLFAKLYHRLEGANLITWVNSTEALASMTAGTFVEFKAVLRKNPLIDTIEAMKALMEMAAPFATEVPPTGGPRKKGGPKQQDQTATVVRQMDALLAALTESRSVDLVGELLNAAGVRAVISSRLDFFNQGNTSEIIDGEFLVFGKATRVVQTSTQEPISLLRKTPLRGLRSHQIEQLAAAFTQAAEVGLQTSEFVTEIPGPALLVFPIAIYT
jgi:hypothetical protein